MVKKVTNRKKRSKSRTMAMFWSEEKKKCETAERTPIGKIVLGEGKRKIRIRYMCCKKKGEMKN